MVLSESLKRVAGIEGIDRTKMNAATLSNGKKIYYDDDKVLADEPMPDKFFDIVSVVGSMLLKGTEKEDIYQVVDDKYGEEGVAAAGYIFMGISIEQTCSEAKRKMIEMIGFLGSLSQSTTDETEQDDDFIAGVD